MEKQKNESAYRKFELEVGTAQKIFDKSDLGPVLEIKRFEQGMINDVFSVNGRYVLKVNTAHPDLSKLEKESSIYEALPAYNIPTPAVVTLDETKEIVGYPFLLMRQIPGQSLESTWGNLSLETQDTLLREMGDLLGKIHNLKPQNVGWRNQEEYLGLKKETTKRITKISDELLASKVLDTETVSKIKDFYLESPLFTKDIEPSLLHGNFGFGNIIVEDNKIKGIIDWEWASFGHNEEELAVLLYRVYKTDLQKEAFMDGYRKSHTISTDFDKRLLAYALLYYLKVLPSVPAWTHRPDKQKEYVGETKSLIKQIGIQQKQRFPLE